MKKFLLAFLLINISCIAQWVHVPSGLDENVISMAVNGNKIFAGSETNGVLTTSNNGNVWTQTSILDTMVYSLAANESYIFAGIRGNGCYVSTNSGLTWALTSLDSTLTIYSLAVNGNRVYAGTLIHGVFLSTNNGLSWIQTLSNQTVYSLVANGNFVFAGTWAHGVYVSTDNGITWLPSSLNENIISMAAISNYVFAGTDNVGIFLSTNYGNNWTHTALNNGEIHSLFSVGNTVFAAVSNIGIYASYNYGSSWVQKNEGLSQLNVRSFCISNTYLFAGTWNSVFRRPINELISINQISNEIPNQYFLYQNYPNPFNPMTNVKFQIPNEGFIEVKVFDVLGNEAASLVSENLSAGTYRIEWDASEFSSGVYYYRLTSGDYSETKKMILIK